MQYYIHFYSFHTNLLPYCCHLTQSLQDCYIGNCWKKRTFCILITILKRTNGHVVSYKHYLTYTQPIEVDCIELEMFAPCSQLWHHCFENTHIYLQIEQTQTDNLINSNDHIPGYLGFSVVVADRLNQLQVFLLTY